MCRSLLVSVLLLLAACGPSASRRVTVHQGAGGSGDEVDAGAAAPAIKRDAANAAPGMMPDAAPPSADRNATPAPDLGTTDTAPAASSTSDARGDLASPDLTEPTISDPVDAAPDRAVFASKKILLLVGNLTLGPGDTALKARLMARGHTVTTVLDSALTDSGARAADLVIVSISIESASLAVSLTDVPVPVLCMEPNLLDDLKVTGAVRDTDYGVVAMSNQINIVSPGHLLAAGLSGTVKVAATTAYSLIWGVPGAAATKVATVVGMANQATVFSYAKGAAMVGMNAPAKRTGWFASEGITSEFTAEGLRLFDAAVDWTAN